MRRPYDIHKKRNEILKKLLTKEVQEKVRVCPKNCKFNQRIGLDGHGPKASLCLYGQHPPGEGEPIDVVKIITCDSNQQARECNARIPRFASEEEARASLAEDLKDPKTRLNHFPGPLALDWVMDNELEELSKNPPNRWTKVMLWLAEFFENRVRQPKFVNKVHKN